jgi:hypothetical protein
MWEGVKGNRLRYGIRASFLGIPVVALLFFLTFYIYFFYLIVPIALFIIFHYSKSWRFTDRAFYGIIVILISFVIAGAGISSTIMNAPHHDATNYVTAQGTYNLYFNYTDTQGNYTINFIIPSANISNQLNISLKDLFTNKTISNYSLSMVKTGSNYSIAKNLGELSPIGYVVYFTFFTLNNTSMIPHTYGFVGPVLAPFTTILYYFLAGTMVGYVLITFAFFMILVYLARMMGTRNRGGRQQKGQSDVTPPDQINLSSGQGQEDSGPKDKY